MVEFAPHSDQGTNSRISYRRPQQYPSFYPHPGNCDTSGYIWVLYKLYYEPYCPLRIREIFLFQILPSNFLANGEGALIYFSDPWPFNNSSFLIESILYRSAFLPWHLDIRTQKRMSLQEFYAVLLKGSVRSDVWFLDAMS